MPASEASEEYEEWAPSLLKRWDALMEGKNRDGKLYTAFLRFALKWYDIPAEARAEWRKNKRGSEKHLALRIHYTRVARTMEEMRRKLAEIREITSAFPPYWFDIEWPNGSITYGANAVWERAYWNGPGYFHDVMCVGKGSVPYMPMDVRAHIESHMESF